MNKGTFLAIVIFVALAAVTVTKLQERPERGITRIDFPAVTAESTTRVVIEGPSPIELRKEGDQWKAGERPADRSAVEQLLEAIAKIESSELVTRNRERFAELEVEGEQATRVQAFAGSAKTADFFVGSTASGGTQVRVDDAVYRVSRIYRTAFARERSAWLDRAIFAEAPDAATRVEVGVRGETPYVLVKDGADWRLEDPGVLPAGHRFDADAARRLVSALVTAQARDVLDEDPGAEISGLDDGGDRLSFRAGDAVRTLTLGAARDDGSVYARASTRTEILTVAPYVAQNLRKTLGDLRDLTLLSVDSGEVRRLELVSGEGHLILEREGTTWKVAETTADPPAGFELDPSAVTRRLGALASLRAVAEADTETAEKTGLEQPSSRAVLTLANDEIVTLAFGTETKRGDDSVVYARGNADERVYLVAAAARDGVLGGLETFARREAPDPLANLDPATLQNLPPEVRESLVRQLAQRRQQQELLEAIPKRREADAAE